MEPTNEALCTVCKTPSSNMHTHFGAMACLNCKAFFRRSVIRNKPWQACKNAGIGCDISTLRNRCQRCRYDRCLAAGMNPGMVLSDDQKKLRYRRMIERNGGLKLSKKRNVIEKEIGLNGEEVWREKEEEEDPLAIDDGSLNQGDSDSLGPVLVIDIKCESLAKESSDDVLLPELQQEPKSAVVGEYLVTNDGNTLEVIPSNIVSSPNLLETTIIVESNTVADTNIVENGASIGPSVHLTDLPVVHIDSTVASMDEKNHYIPKTKLAQQCAECFFTSNHKSALAKHVRAEHKTLQQRNRHTKKIKSYEKRFKCVECKYETRYSGDLKKHVRRVHSAIEHITIANVIDDDKFSDRIVDSQITTDVMSVECKMEVDVASTNMTKKQNTLHRSRKTITFKMVLQNSQTFAKCVRTENLASKNLIQGQSVIHRSALTVKEFTQDARQCATVTVQSTEKSVEVKQEFEYIMGDEISQDFEFTLGAGGSSLGGLTFPG